MMAQQWMLRHFLVESFLCRATDVWNLSEAPRGTRHSKAEKEHPLKTWGAQCIPSKSDPSQTLPLRGGFSSRNVRSKEWTSMND
jgi:hypothetical protein